MTDFDSGVSPPLNNPSLLLICFSLKACGENRWFSATVERGCLDSLDAPLLSSLLLRKSDT